ncbi:conjugative transfer signal peptidase TraF [Duganella sp. FT92W]|uniref:Conjugative transfer signal peptidase TraF n=1 Tax=Pseudoduganella rivuli TaxID=2666085 RepID=A0A7X2LS45_9BURK|nr:conjugative transfer signal peptidase TraF [Pseudoduganella rivuli]MRV70577.1 conjugative transfer signal peptidase TraF [Pseudoduganella rivuli]
MIRDFITHAAHRWYVYLPLTAIWIFALVRLLADPVPHLPVLFNVSPSLPFWIVRIDYHPTTLRRGDYIVYRFEGNACRYFPGLWHQPFLKRIAGLEGDHVTVSGRQVFVNGALLGYAKPYAVTKLPLAPIAPSVIPADHFYVAGTSPDSFDSRYALSGLVAKSQIVGLATPVY